MDITKEQIFLALLPSLYLHELDGNHVDDKSPNAAERQARRAAERARFAAEMMILEIAAKS
ncbi:MAG: hypothetical protein HYV09_32235 [Deltaproteobacteria bacterium]|nr:hypothetical protein [Deltaproteobacteria bacterium]